jgi:carotene epsilon-monooxygenase
VGDQFALMEAVVALAVILKRFEFSLVPGQQINMTTGATIHTTDGLYMNMRERSSSSSQQQQGAAAAAAAAVA